MASPTQQHKLESLLLLPLLQCIMLCIIHGNVKVSASTNPHYVTTLRTPQDCRRTQGDSNHEYFDVSNLTCVACSQNSTIQTVTSDDLYCRCQETYKITRDHGGGHITCEQCPSNMVASSDGWTCVTCSVPPPVLPPTPEPACPWCQPPQLTADRDLDGTFLTNTSGPERRCVTCMDNSSANMDSGRCTRCNVELRVQDSCDCPADRLTGGVCFPAVTSLEPDYPTLYTMNYQSIANFRSAYFEENIRAAHGACAPTWSNLTACQQLANLCVLLLYDLTNTPPTDRTCGTPPVPCNDACSLYTRLTETLPGNRLPSHNTSHPRIQEWRENMAWLFYPANTPTDLRRDASIPTSYGRGSILNLSVARYDVSGGFLGYQDAWQNDVTLCKNPSEEAILFGVQVKFQCDLQVDTLLNSTNSLTFYELNIPYSLGGEERLYAVPILVKNLKDRTGTTPNTDPDASKWQFVRRFYLLDSVSGRDSTDGAPNVVRYLKTSRLHVSLRGSGQNGEIYVPWLELEYAEISSTQYGQGGHVPVSFEIVYTMDLAKHQSDMSIAFGVLSGLAVLYSAFQAYSYNRRQGRVAIDCSTLMYLAVHVCGTLSNTFFIVVFGMAIWWFLLYKLQNTAFLLPTLDGDYYIKAFLGSAFAIKTINIIYLIVSQSSVDLFFMDWERSKMEDSTAPASRKSAAKKVSIWRTYFVANEWNELSTVRSINMPALLFLVMLLLKGVGIENLAKLEPGARLTPDVPGEGSVEFSRTLRFAISAIVYIGCALILWLFYHLIYKTFITWDRLAAFRDLCSLCNVSTFVMTHEQYGYYIHGRTVHGHADVGLKDMYVCLNKEQADLCGQRGLVAGTDQQTFTIALPRRLRSDYNKVLQPMQRARAQRRMRGTLSSETETKLQAYDVLNKFLQNFIDHNLPESDYIVTEKTLFEKILDTEVEDNRDLGYFYTDEGHSFDKSMLYGHEVTLQVFLLLFFTMVDLIGTNFVLSAALTFIIDKAMCSARYQFGRRNIANKTMVDMRLLI